ncbi:protein phosphatase [Cyclospora cayetanensis]|uniref:Protein phosphatase n=1 Tax=Cyclospora cayetanensis TaxID=88456 RepID=A0A1D3D266_9EIME|nr:protein phosphatase [Cyclospora cayetanensis]
MQHLQPSFPKKAAIFPRLMKCIDAAQPSAATEEGDWDQEAPTGGAPLPPPLGMMVAIFFLARLDGTLAVYLCSSSCAANAPPATQPPGAGGTSIHPPPLSVEPASAFCLREGEKAERHTTLSQAICSCVTAVCVASQTFPFPRLSLRDWAACLVGLTMQPQRRQPSAVVAVAAATLRRLAERSRGRSSPTQLALQHLGLAAGVSQVAANSPVEDRALIANVSAVAAGATAAATPAGFAATQNQQALLAQRIFPEAAATGAAAAAGTSSDTAPPGAAVVQSVQLAIRSKEGNLQRPCCLVAIVDGHGGPEVAEYVHAELPRFVAAELAATGDPGDLEMMEKALSRAFCRLDEAIGASVDAAYGIVGWGVGGICCIDFVNISALAHAIKKGVVVANSGDCMAVLQRKGRSSRKNEEGPEVVELNVQHNANSPEERRRLQQLHPLEDDVVICKREWQEPRKPQNKFHFLLNSLGLLGSETQRSACYVKGRLQPTRVFGDFSLKDEKYWQELQRGRRRRSPGSSSTATNAAAPTRTSSEKAPQEVFSFPYVVVEPQTKSFPRLGNEEFVVVGTDGVWDFLTPREAAAIVRSSLEASGSLMNGMGSSEAAQQAADAVVHEVLRRAAEEAGTSVEAILSAPPKQRRRLYDDTTAAIILMNTTALEKAPQQEILARL